MPSALKQIAELDPGGTSKLSRAPAVEAAPVAAPATEAVAPVAEAPAAPAPPEVREALTESRSMFGRRNQEKLGPVLVLGGSGSMGAGIVDELLSRGREARILVREGASAWEKFADHEHLKMIQGDLFDDHTLAKAIEGCEAAVHAYNCPISKWNPTLMQATERVIQVAEHAGAFVLFPSTVHPLGEQCGRALPEATPLKPMCAAGRARMSCEESLETAAADGRIRALTLRISDIYGPSVRNPIVDGIFQNAIDGKPMTIYGKLEAPHQWAYMPDVARMAADLLEMVRSEFAFDRYEVVHFAGHIVRPQKSFYEHVSKVCGHKRCIVDRKSWTGLRLSSSGPRDLLERKHLWDQGVLLDDEKAERLFPHFEKTDLAQSIAETLDAYKSKPLVDSTPLGGRPARLG